MGICSTLVELSHAATLSLALSCSPFGSIHHFFAFSAATAGGAAYMFKAKGESKRASELVGRVPALH